MKKMTQISSYLGVLVILLFTTTAFKSENSHKNLTAQNANEITVLFAYTTNAAFSAGGAANIKRNVDIGLKNLNDALKNSNVSYSVRAIDEFVEVEYNNTAADFSSVDQLLKELRKVDGKFNKVHQFRKQKQADIVCLIFGGYGMGYADLNGEMMVCNYEEGIFGGSYIFPHEFAHNLGATHEAAMLFDWKEAGSRRTLEGNGAVAIPYFSEDRTITMDVAGAKRTFALGDASHDNAKTIRKNAPAKSKLGENLGNVAASNNALAAKLVNPLSVQAPQGPVYS
ncbi:MAG TPA: hypothetical protein VK590_05790, partial [Saprospiraceae bacterium]|nr:hypothetical protein [Saprospiraceae bacterium]